MRSVAIPKGLRVPGEYLGPTSTLSRGSARCRSSGTQSTPPVRQSRFHHTGRSDNSGDSDLVSGPMPNTVGRWHWLVGDACGIGTLLIFFGRLRRLRWFLPLFPPSSFPHNGFPYQYTGFTDLVSLASPSPTPSNPPNPKKSTMD